MGTNFARARRAFLNNPESNILRELEHLSEDDILELEAFLRMSATRTSGADISDRILDAIALKALFADTPHN